MKLIGPASAVVDAQKSTPAKEASGTFKPSPVAASSPSANVFSGAAMQMLTTNPMTNMDTADECLPNLLRQYFQSAKSETDPLPDCLEA